MKRNRIFRKWTAFLLMMSIAAVSPLSYITAYAEPTELEAVELPKNGGGSTTAYLWKDGNIDFEGVKEAALIGADKPYTGDNDRSVRTTYNRRGYSTVIAKTDDKGNYKTVRVPANGGVMDLSADFGVEIQMKAYPSPDQKWILVDYIIYNKQGKDNTIHIASGADIQVGWGDGAGALDPADGSKLTADERGFHMVNRTTQETFDLLTNDEALGLTPPTTRWVGKYSGPSWETKYFTDGPYMCENEDSALTYSWEIALQPYETQLRRVAFGARGPSYYVSAQKGSDDGRGTYDSPFQSIEKVLEVLGEDMGYVYIQDYGEITETIAVSNHITFMSADYNRAGKPIDDIMMLKRADTFTDDPLFETVDGGIVQFSNIILDGNKTGASANAHPLIKASSGGVVIQAGTILQNNQVTEGNVGSGIDITNTADLRMSFGTIAGNVSAGKGAVHFDSDGDFEMMNAIFITENTLGDGRTKANVYLGSGKTITIMDELSGNIGITTADLPEPTEAGSISIGTNHEIKVAKGKAESSINPSYYTNHFQSDMQDAGLRITGSGRDIVLRLDGVELITEYVDEEGGSIQESEMRILAAGGAVDLLPPPLTDYEFDTTRISPAVSGLSVIESGLDKGKVTGTMPNQQITITFQYQRLKSGIYFNANGGTPQPPPLTGNVNEAITATMPLVIKYGYNFSGWYKEADFSGESQISLPDKYEADPITYHAKWEPNNYVFFNYTVRYGNHNGSIIFRSTTSNDKNAGSPINAEMKNIPSYKLKASTMAPALHDGHAVGDFDIVTKNFSGNMPNQDTIVTYAYEVDYSSLSNRNRVKVNYQSAAGTLLDTTEAYYFPEDEITISPTGGYGYHPVSWSVTKGFEADEEQLLTGVTGSFDSNGVYKGRMPNQPVEITYLCEFTGEDYDFIVRYQCGGKDIIEPEGCQLPADEETQTEFNNIYGYVYSSAEVSPRGYGSFNPSTYCYSGIMPNDNLTVIYHYDQDPSKWAVLTYQADNGGVLRAADASAKLRPGLSAGTYEADIIINDGTSIGRGGCYTWAEILERKLVPTPEAAPGYQFNGWYIDKNGNDIMDAGEELAAADSFEGNGEIRAGFTKKAEEDSEPSGFIIETINGVITKVGERVMAETRFDKAKAGDLVEIDAPDQDSQGNEFLYWQILVGDISGFAAKNTQQVITFQMPAQNVVLAARYDTSGNGLANIESELKGGKKGEISLNPEDIPNLEETLTTDEDKILINDNADDVTYKVILQKNKVQNHEAEAVRASADYQQDYTPAFKGAWGLDIRIERYVNQDRTGIATDSNASFTTIVQLSKEDINMMDYQLYQIEKEPGGGIEAILIPFDENPAASGGLFHFEAKVDCRYVFVYSEAYQVTFLNETASKEFPLFPPVFHHTFRVRKNEAITAANYESEWQQIEQPVQMLLDKEGVQHDYVGWSTANMPNRYREFDFTRGITRDTIVYAYYKNNSVQLKNKRNELEQTIAAAEKLSEETLLKPAEVNEMTAAAEAAAMVFHQTDRKAAYEELDEALQKLTEVYERISKKLAEYQKEADKQKPAKESGGSSGQGAISLNPQNIYYVGQDGHWVLVDGQNVKWSFFLNSGIPLREMWAWIVYGEGDTEKTGWYYFDDAGIMSSGWFKDKDLCWYYLDTHQDSCFGKMKTGWHLDNQAGFKYYLQPETGAMATGWQFIDSKWYYFTTGNHQSFGEQPVGSLLTSGRTPDGYMVDGNGMWIE